MALTRNRIVKESFYFMDKVLIGATPAPNRTIIPIGLDGLPKGASKPTITAMHFTSYMHDGMTAGEREFMCGLRLTTAAAKPTDGVGTANYDLILPPSQPIQLLGLDIDLTSFAAIDLFIDYLGQNLQDTVYYSLALQVQYTI